MRSAVMSGLRAGGRFALDLVLPPGCACCGEEVGQPGMACPACFARFRMISDPSCARCGTPLASTAFASGDEGCCMRCRRHPPLWNRARAAFVYDGASRRLILAFKYADQTGNAGMLASRMVQAGRVLLEEADLLIPVPVHWKRLFHRRYNQAALLAIAIGRQARLPVMVDGLRRPHATGRLAGFSAAERARVMRGAVEIRPSRRDSMVGRRIVLVDDVLTTGATAGACASALLAAGVASVDVLAAARTEAPAWEDLDRPLDL